MLCQNCGENEANVRYTKIVNGVKKEMALCEKCSKELGINSLDFSMPINLSSFLGDFLKETANETMSSFAKTKEMDCKECGMSFDDFVKLGKFGCSNCYSTFENRIDSILKNIQGANTHIGRKGKLINCELEKAKEKVEEKQIKKEISKIEDLKQQLKKAIKDERYEDAAKIRDEIKEIEK